MKKLNKLLLPFCNNKKLIIWEVISTVVFYLMVHGYRLFNNMFSGDSLMMINQIDHTWQVAIGRFMTPFFILLRGTIIAPWMVGIMSMAMLSLSVVIVCNTFNVQKKSLIILISALMASNLSITGTYISFINNADEFSFALLAAVLGAYLIINSDVKDQILTIIIGSFSIALSMGAYQAYVDVAIVILIIDIFLRLLTDKDIIKIVVRGLKYIASLLLSAGLYYAIWKLIQKIFHVWTADTYNGLEGVSDFTDSSVLGLVGDSYQKVFNFFFNHSRFLTMTFHGQSMDIIWTYLYRAAIIILFVLFIWSVVKINLANKVSWINVLLEVIILLLLPLGINFVNVISKGMEHLLMIYSFVFLLILWALVIYKGQKKALPVIVLCLLLGLTIWSDYIYSNQVYLKKQLNENISNATMNRIVLDIEHYPDYKPGETPVAFVGTFEKSDYIIPIEGLESLRPYSLGKTSMNYNATIYSLIRFNMSVNMKYSWTDPSNPYLKTMPSYPQKGYIDMVDDVLVVKISE